MPYRDSKLTRMLKESLSGNTKTIMIACVYNSSLSYDEVENTLQYASKARKIEKKTFKNVKEVESSNINNAQIDLIEKLNAEIENLKKIIRYKFYSFIVFFLKFTKYFTPKQKWRNWKATRK